ncbi:type II toxin-antitoxin system prevent-host-death family antitoxin [Solwaraspora sp. WMMD406]|uniref:type II toxin-antitoxin system prevent-host-death family antitoxin n=1 Tax=Solwaraspora sp. WMMD406 TaxID=3016095 RepID=UPI002417C097|nr:type II toxin-antitoxin system prevent-host-death family antitoxin [Solwaraspora sp. WMMD406]MDG4764576.1 type II toxin-antitoxin system prevent-host-death family antitoxin [Solwaraspora sp. WMMD406]
MLRAAERGEPQIVTRHGEEVAVVVDIAEYRRLRGAQTSLMEYLRGDPCLDDDFEIERQRDLPHDIDLVG